jgi:methylase of polypeptide subunit release factors
MERLGVITLTEEQGKLFTKLLDDTALDGQFPGRRFLSIIGERSLKFWLKNKKISPIRLGKITQEIKDSTERKILQIRKVDKIGKWLYEYKKLGIIDYYKIEKTNRVVKLRCLKVKYNNETFKFLDCLDSPDNIKSFVETFQDEVEEEVLRDIGFIKKPETKNLHIKSIEEELKSPSGLVIPKTEHELRKCFEKFGDIKKLIKLTKTIDSRILHPIRDHRLLTQEELIGEYSLLLRAEFKEECNMELDDFLEELESFNFLKNYEFLKINPDLVVNIDKDFNKIIFKYDELELTIDNPKLLWDCHCHFKPEDRTKKAANTPCPIHRYELGAEVDSKFGEGIVQIQYDGIKVLWHESDEFWPPSVDTIRMFENLKRDGVMNKQLRSVIDIGSGTGFLGIAIAKLNQHIQKLYLSDWLFTPVVLSRINWEINKGNKTHVSCIPLIGIGKNWLNHNSPKEPFDICVCNPPYLPSLENFPEIPMSHTVGGTELLEFVIKEGHKIAQEIYVNFSNLADEEAFSAAAEVNAELIKIGEQYKVPFRVPHAFNVRNYVKELSEKRGLEVSESETYKYWHTITTYKIIYDS